MKKTLVTILLGCLFITAMLTGCTSYGNADSSTGSVTSNSPSAKNTANNDASDTNAIANEEITIVSREDGSGTRSAFIELFGVETTGEDGKKVDNTTLAAIITNSTSVVMTTVSGDKNAMGYLSLGSLNDTVKALSIDGAQPSVANIENGTYTIARPFIVATKGDLSEAAQDFMDYILSTQGQKIVNDNGYIPIKDTKDYTGSISSGKIVVAGSSSVTPVMEKLKEGYLALNSGITIEIQQSDSSTGMNNTKDGVCDIGMASRELKSSETEAGLVPIVIANDGIVVVVNNNNPLTNLTKEQVMQIYTGEITKWGDIS